MLQQTRVAAVLEHYGRFMALFPSIVALALAREQEVLAAWSGLGYYRRAKLLHKAAQFVVREHQGSLPRTAEQLRMLPESGSTRPRPMQASPLAMQWRWSMETSSA